MKKLLSVLGIVILIAVAGITGYFSGQTFTTLFIKNQTISLDHINQRIEESKKQLDSLSKDEDNKRQDLANLSTDLKEAKDLITQRDKIKEELAQLDGTKQQIEQAKIELEKTKHAIAVAKDEPKALYAGQYIVGQDFEAGRYKIESDAHGDTSGILNTSISEAHINLGNNKYSQKEYVVTLIDGEKMDVTIPVKLVKIMEPTNTFSNNENVSIAPTSQEKLSKELVSHERISRETTSKQ